MRKIQSSKASANREGKATPQKGFSVLILFAFFMMLAGAWLMPVYAVENLGVLSGTVADKETGKPIENVYVTATGPSETYTATTDATGYFSIAGVYPGTYQVILERAGYQTATYTEVMVTGNATTNMQFSLSTRVYEVKGITVTGYQSPTINPKETMTNYGYSDKEIKSVFPGPEGLSIVSLYESLPGVTVSYDAYYGAGQPHIRGGTGSDIGYAFDGVPTYETITDTFGTNLTNVGTQTTQFYVGAYPAQYGNYLSSYINQVVKRGYGPAHGSLQFQYGFWMDQGQKLPSYDALTGTVTTYNGDLASNPDNISFDIGGSVGKFHYYLNHIVQDQGVVPYAQGVDVKPLVFEYGGITNHFQERDTVANFNYDLDNHDNLQLLLYESIQKFNFAGFQEEACNPAVLGSPPCFGTNALTGFGETYNAFAIAHQQDFSESASSDMEKLELVHRFPSPGKVLDVRLWRYNPDVYFDYFAFPAPFWEFRRSAEDGILIEHQNQLTPQHLLDIGASFVYSKNYFMSAFNNVGAPADSSGLNFNAAQQILFGGPAGIDSSLDVIRVPDTQTWAAWLSDEWRPTPKWVINVGLRWDKQNYLKITGPGIITDVNAMPFVSASKCANGIICLDPARFNPSLITPRVGASYKLTDRLTMKASYGKFVTYAPARRVELVTSAGVAVQSAGSKLQRGESLDVSWEYALNDNTYLKLTPYIKHIVDPLQSTTVNGIPTFTNAGTIESKGIEVLLKTEDYHGLQGWLSYTLSNTTGTQLPFEGTLLAADPAFTPTQVAAFSNSVVPVSYDERHFLSLNLNYKTPNKKWEIAPNLTFGSGFPYGIGAAQLQSLADISGQPFTNPRGEAGFNSLRLSPWTLMNVALTYHVNENMDGIFNIFNLLNSRQIIDVDNSVGGCGYIETAACGYASFDGSQQILPQYNPLKGNYAPIGYPSLRQFYVTLNFKY